MYSNIHLSTKVGKNFQKSFTKFIHDFYDKNGIDFYGELEILLVLANYPIDELILEDNKLNKMFKDLVNYLSTYIKNNLNESVEQNSSTKALNLIQQIETAPKNIPSDKIRDGINMLSDYLDSLMHDPMSNIKAITRADNALDTLKNLRPSK